MRECGAGWTPRELPGVPGSHRSPRSPYLLPQVPPVQGITLRPGSFAGPNVPGGQSPARVGCTTAGAGATTPRPPPSSTPALLPGREPGSRGVPSFPILSPGGGAARPPHSHRDRRRGLFSCGGISCWGRRGPSSGGLSRYGAIICWLQLFSPLVTGPVWAAGHALESPRVPGAIGEWGHCLCLSLLRG